MQTITGRLAQIEAAGKEQAPLPLSSGAYFDVKHESTHTARKNDWNKSKNWNADKLRASQTRRIRHAAPNKITVYRDMIKVSQPDYANGRVERDQDTQGGGIRGDIVGFSRASRKRMIEFMAKVRDEGDMYFVTMTYDDDTWLFKHEAHHDDFEAFRHRFQRAFPNWKALWRVEVKERKSGVLTGWRVPHFHLLIWTGRNDDDETKEANAIGLQAWGVRAWGKILQTENPHFEHYGFHVSAVRSRKHAYSYVAKYIGKEDNDEIACGRRWGRIGKFNCSSSETITLTDDEATYLKRLIKRWLRNKSTKFAKRFSRGKTNQGYTIFGVGDGLRSGGTTDIFYGINQFIVEVRRWSAENEQRERGHGN